MSDVVVKLKDSLTEPLENKMRQEFVEHEVSHGIVCNYKPFSLHNNTASYGKEFAAISVGACFSIAATQIVTTLVD